MPDPIREHLADLERLHAATAHPGTPALGALTTVPNREMGGLAIHDEQPRLVADLLLDDDEARYLAAAGTHLPALTAALCAVLDLAGQWDARSARAARGGPYDLLQAAQARTSTETYRAVADDLRDTLSRSLKIPLQ